MINAASPFSQLDMLLNAYMHQDWDTYGDTINEVFQVFMQETPAYNLLLLQEELWVFLESADPDADFRLMYPNSIIPPDGVEDWFECLIAQIEAFVTDHILL